VNERGTDKGINPVPTSTRMADDGDDTPSNEGTDLCESMTVTLALDTPSPNLAGQDMGYPSSPPPTGLPAELLHIGPPADGRHHCPPTSFPTTLFIHHMPSLAAQALEMRLNSPALGRMRNWEFLAAQLGCSMDEIAGRRRRENPTRQLLQQFGRDACQCGRRRAG